MKVVRPCFGFPILCIDDFLSQDDAQKILTECFDLKKVYAPARVYHGATDTTVDPYYRANEVVYLDDVFRTAPERSDILRILKTYLWSEKYRRLWHDGYYIFDIINYATSHEVVISRFGNNDFFKKHQDTRRDNITYRLVTMIYYVARCPGSFSGGRLKLWHNDDSLSLEPVHNRAIVFPSFSFHEVETVQMQSSAWEDSRFSINYWLGFR